MFKVPDLIHSFLGSEAINQRFSYYIEAEYYLSIFCFVGLLRIAMVQELKFQILEHSASLNLASSDYWLFLKLIKLFNKQQFLFKKIVKS